ncbi:unnamed protein product, partial [Prunus armeniaca]
MQEKNRKFRFEHEEKGDFATSPKHFRLAIALGADVGQSQCICTEVANFVKYFGSGFFVLKKFTIKFHQYQVVGRKLPTASIEHPKIYRMKLWATNEVRTKSKFWYFLRKLKKVKKSNGQVLAINESMLFCGGEVVPPQLSSWLNPICCQ